MSVVLWATTLCGLACLVIGSRGRVVGRGQYCRSCRFDLEGLELTPPASPPSRCPECGARVGPPIRPRKTIRARSWRTVSLGLIVLVLAGSGWSTRLAAVQSWVMPRLSDHWLLSAHESGFERAIDEVVARLSDDRTLRPAFSGLVDEAMASVTTSGQNRSGVQTLQSVLEAALIGGQLSDEQARRFGEASLHILLDHRQLVYAGDLTVPLSAGYNAAPVGGAAGGGGTSLYSVRFELDLRPPEEEAQWFITPANNRAYPRVLEMEQRLFFNGSSTSWTIKDAPVTWSQGTPRLRVAARVMLLDPRRTKPVYESRRLLDVPLGVVPDDESLVPVLDDRELLDCLPHR